MPADSLLDMARRVACRNVHKITDVGDISYKLIRPVLLKVESPEKLYQLEQNSPQLVGNTAELWLNFMKRDIPDYDLQPHTPENPKSWYRVYKKLKKDASKASSDAEALLKATLSGIKTQKEQNTAEVVSTAKGNALYSSTGAPGPSRRAKQIYNYNSGKTGARGAHKMTLMDRIRKEARSASPGIMGRPMHELQRKHNGVSAAPAQFVEDVKRMKVLQNVEAKKALSPPPRRPAGITARRPNPPMHAPGNQDRNLRAQAASASGVEPYDMTADREARLRALKSGQPMPPRTAAATARISDSALATTHAPTPMKGQAQANGHTNNNLTLDFLEFDSNSDDDLVDEKPSRKRQREEDDELFGTTTTTVTPPPPTKRKRSQEDDSGLPRKKLSPTPTSDEDVSPLPKVPRATIDDRGEIARKLLKPVGEINRRPQSRSPLTLSPASSPRLGPVKKRAAPSLFMKKK
ncbi:hypothetical protein H2200_001267 [Cladophialophora chaetospira]|uniref:Elongin-A n=1 Tax=Cladophialophora chaetospira TaxID=386627 RepID=A0AA38XLH8_9EURO|nr:hypothetical protein H2200_001267 [Cladophialophora chaetospira]